MVSVQYLFYQLYCLAYSMALNVILQSRTPSLVLVNENHTAVLILATNFNLVLVLLKCTF